MAADRIVVNRTKQLGNLLVGIADRLNDLRSDIQEANDIGAHGFAGSDYSVFEADAGLVAGTGANTLTLLGLVNTIFNSNTDVTGASRLSQLGEFVARLARQ